MLLYYNNIKDTRARVISAHGLNNEDIPIALYIIPPRYSFIETGRTQSGKIIYYNSMPLGNIVSVKLPPVANTCTCIIHYIIPYIYIYNTMPRIK